MLKFNSATGQKTDWPSTRQNHWFSQSKAKFIYQVHLEIHCHIPWQELPRGLLTLLLPCSQHIRLPVSPRDKTSHHISWQPHLPLSAPHMHMHRNTTHLAPSPIHMSQPSSRTSRPSTTHRSHCVPHRRWLCMFLMVSWMFSFRSLRKR